ncbi:unnamed protein product [Gordionus sp. m RMFG-2023]
MGLSQINEAMMMVGTIILVTFIVLLAILIGWLIVWKCFLLQFQFVRELCGKYDKNDSKKNSKSSKIL